MQLVQLDVLDLAQPAVEGGDVGRDGAHVDALGREDDGVLTLIDGDLDRPIDDGIEAGLVHGLTIALVEGVTGGKDHFVELGVSYAVHLV